MKAVEVPKPIGRAAHDSSCRYIRDGYYLQRCCRRCCCSRWQTHYDCRGILRVCPSSLSLSLSTYHFSRPLPTPSYTPSSRPSATTRTLYLFGPLDFARLEASPSPPSIIYRPGSRGDCYLATVNRDLPREILAIYERASEQVSERASERFRHAASRAIIETRTSQSLFLRDISVHLRGIAPSFIYPVDQPRGRCISSSSAPLPRETFVPAVERERQRERNIPEPMPR